MNKKKTFRIALILIFVVGIAVGLFLSYRLSGYGVIAMILFGIVFFICLFAGISVLGRKHEKAAKILRFCVIGVLCAGTLFFSAVEAIIVSNSRSDTAGETDYVIVLGAGVDGKNPSLILTNRLETALSYLGQHPKTKAILSGAKGQHEEISEADCMYTWLTERGVSSDRLIMEERAKNTAENIVYSLKLINSDNVKQNVSIAILTSEFHLYRAKLIGQKYGIEKPVGIAAVTSLPFVMLNYYIREAFAVAAFWVFGA